MDRMRTENEKDKTRDLYNFDECCAIPLFSVVLCISIPGPLVITNTFFITHCYIYLQSLAMAVRRHLP